MYSENKDVNSVAYYVMDVIENGNYAIKKRAKKGEFYERHNKLSKSVI